MIFIWLSPIFLLVNFFYIVEILKWLSSIADALSKKKASGFICQTVKLIKVLFAVLWGLSSVAIYVAFLLPSNLSKADAPFLYALKRILKLIGNYHLGVFIYMGMALAVILLCRLFELLCCRIKGVELKKSAPRFAIRRAILGVIYVAFVIIITLIGVHKAGDIKTNYYDITINKSCENMKDLKIVLVADLHLGYNIGCKQMEKMVSLINEESADLVVVAGDIFDNEYDALDDPDRLIEILSSIQSKYGTYAVYGNHDISERIIGGFTFNWKDPAKGSSSEMDNFLEKCGFKLLSDEYVLINESIYLYGRPDRSKPGKNIIARKTPKELAGALDLTKPLFVIDHEPYELNELANAGVDIDLSGHTHDGQFFPMNLTSRYFTWENSAGLLMKDSMASIVTSGVGLFGPNIRIGTQAEICSITIHFE